MANTTNFSVRMDSDIKKQCETLYNELGVNLTTAINVFLRQSLRAGDLAWLLGGPAAPGETPVNIDELAEACGGFSYELLCLLGQGSPRVYHK